MLVRREGIQLKIGDRSTEDDEGLPRHSSHLVIHILCVKG